MERLENLMAKASRLEKEISSLKACISEKRTELKKVMKEFDEVINYSLFEKEN